MKFVLCVAAFSQTLLLFKELFGGYVPRWSVVLDKVMIIALLIAFDRWFV